MSPENSQSTFFPAIRKRHKENLNRIWIQSFSISTQANNPGPSSSSDIDNSNLHDNDNDGAGSQDNQPLVMKVWAGEAILGIMTTFTEEALNTALREALYTTETEARIFNNWVENAISSTNESKDLDNESKGSS